MRFRAIEANNRSPIKCNEVNADTPPGTKVVPTNKSVHCRLKDSIAWIRAKAIGQSYVYLIDSKYIHVRDRGTVDCVCSHDWPSDGGDYFLYKDLILYEEK
jgi:hypothetical protein